MPGSEPDLKDTFGSSDTLGAAERSAAAPVVALGEAPAVVTMDGPPPRSRALWVVGAAFAGAVGVAGVAWPQGLGERVTDVDTKEVVDEKATDVAAKAVAVDTKAIAGDAKAVGGDTKAVVGDAKAIVGDVKAGDGDTTKVVTGDAKAIVGGETKAGGGDGKAETKAGEAKTVTPPGVRLLTREQLKRRLGSELAACRSKFADESIVVRVTPGRGGKVDKLASVDDGQLASGMVRCVEKELARMLVGLKDGVEAKKTFDVPKAG